MDGRKMGKGWMMHRRKEKWMMNTKERRIKNGLVTK